MKKFSVLTGVLAISLAALTAVPASASAPSPRPLRLASYSVFITSPPPTIPQQDVPNGGACDRGSRLYCGYVGITANFSGLGNRPRPQSPAPNLNLVGSVSVTRTYGCTNRNGRVNHRFDRTVRETAPLDTRRSSGGRIPATGDTVSMTTLAFLLDLQPFNCPPGLKAVNTSIVVKGAKLELASSFDSVVPDQAYNARRWASWYGVAPTPPRAGG
jgi:hypothetical protein